MNFSQARICLNRNTGIKFISTNQHTYKKLQIWCIKTEVLAQKVLIV